MFEPTRHRFEQLVERIRRFPVGSVGLFELPVAIGLVSGSRHFQRGVIGLAGPFLHLQGLKFGLGVENQGEYVLGALALSRKHCFLERGKFLRGLTDSRGNRLGRQFRPAFERQFVFGNNNRQDENDQQGHYQQQAETQPQQG